MKRILIILVLLVMFAPMAFAKTVSKEDQILKKLDEISEQLDDIDFRLDCIERAIEKYARPSSGFSGGGSFPGIGGNGGKTPRRGYGELTDERRRLLERLGIDYFDLNFDNGYRYSENASVVVPAEGN